MSHLLLLDARSAARKPQGLVAPSGRV